MATEIFKVGAVNYLNTKPLLYGLQQSPINTQIELIQDYPANIAKLLQEQKIDIGLVPVAIIPTLGEHYLISNYCIGATQAVASVAIFSEVPLKEIKTIILDYQSKTSVDLVKILFQRYFKQTVQFIEASDNYIQDIKGTTAGLVIGDRALEIRKSFPFIIDLAQEWVKFTKLPFVFATWVANKKIPQSFIAEFNKANAFGLQNIDKVIAQNPYEHYDLKEYYTKNISYNFDMAKQTGLHHFLFLLSSRYS